MISHARTQALVSARLDAPLDPLEQRELLAHLATCPACRAFAQQTEGMARDLRALPVLPASPTVSRVVLERINAGRSPWARFGDLFAANPVPAVALALVALLLVGGLTAARFTELDVNDLTGDGNEPRSLMAPTAPAESAESVLAVATTESTEVAPTATAELPNITVTLTPTAPATPTATATDEPTPTETIAPTATDPPARMATNTPTTEPTPEPTEPPTELPAPTETVAPTATNTPEPTATATSEPTPANTLEPTATATATAPPPTETPRPTETPLPTATNTPEPTLTLTPEPTATDTPAPPPTNTPEPTATSTPPPTETPTPTETPEPTATPLPTETPVPTVTPSPTAEPADTSPAIVPVDGTAVEDEATTETETTEVDSEGDADRQIIVGGEQVTEIPDDEDTSGSGGEGDDADDDSGDDDGQGPESGDDDPDDDDDDDDNSGPGSDSGDDDGQDNSGSGSGNEDATDDADGGQESDPNRIVPIGEQATEEATDPAPTEPGVVQDPLEPTATATAASSIIGTPSAGEPAESGEIVPIGSNDDPVTDPAGATETADATGSEAADAGDASVGLGDAEVFAPAPASGPQRLALGDGVPVLADSPGIASLSNGDGVLEIVPTDGGQALQVCAISAPDECVVLSEDAGAAVVTDTPLGWVEGRAIYVREAGDVVTYYGVDASGGESTLLLTGGPELAINGPVIDLRDRLLVPGADVWISLGGFEGAQVGPNPYGEVGLVRTRLPKDLVGFVADGELVIAPEGSPDTPVAQFEFTGEDFDVSPDGASIAISTGETIIITDFTGTQLRTFANPSCVVIGSVLWLDDGIYFVDESSEVVRVVDPDDAA